MESPNRVIIGKILIIGKIYEAKETPYFGDWQGGNNYPDIWIVDGCWEHRSNFITLEEYRNNKLVELMN
jgi:hypothetical protein